MWSAPHADSRRGVWLLIAAATIVLRLPLVVQPYFFAQDEATYSALAVRLLAGATPYVSAVDHKPPGAELLYASIYAVAGRNHALAIHVVLLLWVIATAIIVGEIGAARIGDSGRIAGVLYAVGSTLGPPGDMQAANTELLLNLPAAIAALCVGRALARSRDRGAAVPLWLAAGVFTAAAAFFKYQASLLGVAWAAAAVWPRPPLRAAAMRLMSLAGGFLVVAAAYCAWFWAIGAWDAFTFWGWRFNFSYINDLDTTSKLGNAIFYTALIALLWSPLVILAIVRVRERAVDAFLVAWLGAGLLCTSVGGRFFPHYYLMALPPMALLAAGAWPTAALVRRAVGVLTTASVLASAIMAWGWLDLKPGLRRHHEAYTAIGRFVGEQSARSDTLFVWGNSSPIYYYADRVMGTRFPFTNYQSGMIWGTPADTAEEFDTSTLVVPRAWQELLDDLDRERPTLIVDAAAGRLDRFDRHPMTAYPELRERLQRYERIAVINGAPVYRLKRK